MPLYYLTDQGVQARLVTAHELSSCPPCRSRGILLSIFFDIDLTGAKIYMQCSSLALNSRTQKPVGFVPY